MPSRPRQFRPRHAPPPGEAKKDYELRRGSARGRGYTAAWDETSLAEKRLHPLCLGCEAVGLVAATEVIDHTIPHKGDRELFWDPRNRQPSCNWHHGTVKQILELRYKAGQIGADALRLDSPQAIALTRELMEAGEGPR